MTSLDHASEAPSCPAYDPSPRPIDVQLPECSCDTHFHIFGPLDEYPYKAERSYTPPEAPESAYRHMLQTYGFSRAVFIQPSVYGTDNSRMLSLLSEEDDGIQWRGIAVVDDNVTDAELERMHALGVRGIRLNLLYSGGIDLKTGLKLANRVAPLGWHVQFLIDVSEFPRLARRLEQLPLPSVIDHMGHMPAAKSIADPGFRDLLAVLREGQSWVKLSGAYRVTGLQHPPYTDADPIAHALIESNPDCLVFGTDWPHPGIKIPMPNDSDLMADFLRWMDNDAALTDRVLVKNPARLYEF